MDVLLFHRTILTGIALLLLALAFRWRHQIQRIIVNYFTEATHPVNLAIFRIVLFGTLIAFVDIPEAVWFSELPEELRFLPKGFGWVFNYLPINPTLVQVTGILLIVFSFTAMIGLFTRTSAWLTVIFGFYVLSISQLFGKIDHYNHMLWFPAILAASRCGEVLSVDAVLAAWKRADRGVVEPPSSSSIYALPIRFVWLLMGMIYFFPGVAKLWASGFLWAFSDNLKFRLYQSWIDRADGWMPFFRVDKYPALYQPAALGAILFEISFIFLIFLPRWRMLAVVGGLSFHTMTNWLMRIPFWTLRNCYVVFFDWHAIFNRIGRWLFPKEMYVIYDGQCKFCRRTIASLRVFDILGRLTFVNVYDLQTLKKHNLNWLDFNALAADMHAVVDKKTWLGFSAYRAFAPRIPIFWPILPLLYVWPVPKIGNRIYRKVASSRTCNRADQPSPNTAEYKPRVRTRALVTVGIILLMMNFFYGIRGRYDAWPFSCYPTFGRLVGPTKEKLEVVVLNSTGETLPFDQTKFQETFSFHRFTEMSKRILKLQEENPAELNLRLNALWQALEQHDSTLKSVASVQFYETTLITIPERRNENPLSRKLLYQFKPHALSSSTSYKAPN